MSWPGEDDRRQGVRAGLPRTVLVVDDSRTIRQILSRVLVEAGYRVLQAGDGQAGLAACRAEMPDLVLLDVDMPVMDGLEAMRNIRADPALRDLPVLFLTARTAGTDVAEGLGLGAQDYLRKPCEPAELMARVATAIRLKDQELELRRANLELGSLSTTDPLTGLGNRRRLELEVAGLAGRENRRALVAVALADIDRFKLINDTEGHLVGDTVLMVLARRLQAATQDGDTLVRWGGEEFLLLRAGADAATIADTAEQMRARSAASPMAVGVDHALEVTISVGCAAGTLDQLTQVIAAADEALYRAKADGRNRVRTAARG